MIGWDMVGTSNLDSWKGHWCFSDVFSAPVYDNELNGWRNGMLNPKSAPHFLKSFLWLNWDLFLCWVRCFRWQRLGKKTAGSMTRVFLWDPAGSITSYRLSLSLCDIHIYSPYSVHMWLPGMYALRIQIHMYSIRYQLATIIMDMHAYK